MKIFRSTGFGDRPNANPIPRRFVKFIIWLLFSIAPDLYISLRLPHPNSTVRTCRNAKFSQTNFIVADILIMRVLILVIIIRPQTLHDFHVSVRNSKLANLNYILISNMNNMVPVFITTHIMRVLLIILNIFKY